MFQQLVPLLRQRSVLLTVTILEDDQIRINIIPKKLKEGENNALTTPMSFTGTADELDAQLPDAIVSFVASHLELKNTLARAKEEMDAAAKAAQEEARNKGENNKKPASESAISGADTIDQLIKLHASLLQQPTARARTQLPYVSESHSLYRDQPRCDRDSENLAGPGKVLHTTTS
jgi:PRTRC genetic system protein E